MDQEPVEPRFEDSVIPEVYDIDLLRRIAGAARGVAPDEAAAGLDGRYVYDNLPDDPDAGQVALAATRFDVDAVIRVIERHDALYGPLGADRTPEVAAVVRASLGNYFTLRGAAALDAEGYAAYVQSLPPEDTARLRLAQARILLDDLSRLGLTREEYRLARNRMLAALRPDDAPWTIDQLARAIERLEFFEPEGS